MKALLTTLTAVALVGCADLKYVPVDLSFVTDPRMKVGLPEEQQKLKRDIESIVVDIASGNGKRDVHYVRRGNLLLIEAKERDIKLIRSTIDQIRVQCGLEAATWEVVPSLEKPPDQQRDSNK